MALAWASARCQPDNITRSGHGSFNVKRILPDSHYYYYLPRNKEMIQIMTAITITTAIMPTTAPALKIPPITEQLLRFKNAKNNAV